MGFNDNFPGVFDRIFAQLGTLGTYTPLIGDAVECYVIVVHDAMVQLDGYETGVVTLGTIVKALVGDVGAPSIGSTFVVGTATYTVKRIESNNNKVIQMAVK